MNTLTILILVAAFGSVFVGAAAAAMGYWFHRDKRQAKSDFFLWGSGALFGFMISIPMFYQGL